ncbi:MAG: chemotaxis protein CheX [Deltaproteobacteria bacterium]|nr:chemotaxis protein CheX [Deltaproteobacteria bacterium]
MDIKFINPFLAGTVNVLKTMAFVDPKPGKPYLKKDNLAVGDISGIIGLTGAAKGSMAVSFSEKCILKIVSNMLGEELKAIDKDIEDAVGEITNMISGNARKFLEAEGYTITAAIPTVVSGRNHKIKHVLGGASIIIPFEIDGEPFVVDICLAV